MRKLFFEEAETSETKKMIPKVMAFILFVLFMNPTQTLAHNCKPAISPVKDTSLKNIKSECYQDNSGFFQVDITGRPISGIQDKDLFSSVTMTLFKSKNNNSIQKLLSVSENSGENFLGVEVLLKWDEILDIDGDGQIDPIFIYRFYESDETGKPNYDPYSGQIKIVLLYRLNLVEITGTSGTLDSDRKTTASKSYFKLPSVIQKHLVAMIERLYKKDVFGSSNGSNGDFSPKQKKLGDHGKD